MTISDYFRIISRVWGKRKVQKLDFCRQNVLKIPMGWVNRISGFNAKNRKLDTSINLNQHFHDIFLNHPKVVLKSKGF